MNKPQARDRLLRWVAVPAMAAVLVGLAILQYRWSGQVSDATRAQMLTNLHVSLMSFRQDFAHELGAVAIEIRTVADNTSAVNPEQLNEEFHRLQQSAPHPGLVSHIYLWADPTHQQPLRFDPASSQFERTAWPAEFDPMQQRLLEITRTHHFPAEGTEAHGSQHGFQSRSPRNSDSHHGQGTRRTGMRRRMLEMMMPWAIDQSIPAIACPLRRQASSEGPANRADVTWLIIQLNPNVLKKEIFPELTQKFFGSPSGMDYYVAVRAVGDGGEGVVYSSGPGSGEEKSLSVDAALNLFGPPFGHGGPPNAGMEFFSAPTRPHADHALQTDEQHMAALERLPRFDPFHYAQGQDMWEITATHKSGSVEAAVGALRRRNLMASFGVLGVLAITMGLIVVASQRARRLARLQMDFVAGVSHELRTPLAVISSAAENIAHGVVEDKQQLVRYGNTIVKQSRQLTQLVEQVLLFAATQQHRHLGHGRVNISEVIESALEGTSSEIAAAGFTVERRIESGLPAVDADFTALVRSLQNLITNAVKYGGEKRWLRISAVAEKRSGRVEEVKLTVEDKGIGIGKDEIQHIFEPFYRSPAVSESGIHGTGLGLPLARTIVEAMGGRITAISELGKGSAFSIHLRVTPERTAEQTQGAADKPADAEPDFSS